MGTRIWLIALLVVWIGAGVANPQVATGSRHPVEVRVQNWRARVTYPARQRALHSRVRRHPRPQRRRTGRKRPPLRRATPPAPVAKPTPPTSPSTPAPAPPDTHTNVHDPQRWGLTLEQCQALPDDLYEFWARYAPNFKTCTRDTSSYAYQYLRALLYLETDRNYAHIGRAVGVAGENIQHFMSKSPWSAPQVMAQARAEIQATPDLAQGGMLLLDESATQSGAHKAGAARQYNGRLGKVELSQMGTFLAYANLTHPECPLWTWVDGELYLPKAWFTPEMAAWRQRVGLPATRQFATKIELGWQMIQRAQAEGFPFEAVACDDLYGRSVWFRDRLAAAGITYMADVPHTTQVYLKKPVLGIPPRQPGQPGPAPQRLRVINGVKATTVQRAARRSDTHWVEVHVRPLERGELRAPFAARRVWTLREGQTEPVAEWLVVRQENSKYNYSLSNAPGDTSLEALAWLKCQRYFVERANQDAKSEAGWDELRARKYRGWEHHLALTILAVWFVAQTKWAWAHAALRDPTLAAQLAVDILPALSMANIRLMLRAADPLPQPTPAEALARVTEHLVNRTRSRASRLKRQQRPESLSKPPP